MIRTLTPLRMAPLWAALALVGCGVKPEKLLEQIGNGDAANALETLEAARAKEQDPTLRNTLGLLEAYARLQLCAERGCATNAGPALPDVLKPVATLLSESPAPAMLGEGLPTITSNSVVASATLAFAALPNQPTAMLTLRTALPAERAEAQLGALAAPILALARQGKTDEAGHILRAVDTTAGLSEGFRFTAGWLAAMLANDTEMLTSRVAALRAQSTAPEAASAALLQVLPRALFAQTGSVTATLAQLNSWLSPNSLYGFGALKLPKASHTVAQELATLAQTPPQAWNAAWDAKTQGPLSLALQRAALGFNPNQPAVWQAYLQGLVAASSSGQAVPELMLDERGMALAQGVAGPSRPELGKALLAAASKLQSHPSTAAPLLYLASQLNLASPQQAELDKLAQTLLVKAAQAKDITATLALAQARPQAAANNRQLVAPLLVEDIKTSLRNGQFARAISTSTLIDTQLNLPVELGPLVLEEFNADLQRRGVMAQLDATSPTTLVQPQDVVTLDLGPIWEFMETHFAARPEVLRGQLTTLISAAKGQWGPPTAMYRLLDAFPAADQATQRSWLNTAIVAAALEDSLLTGPELAGLSGRLLAVHTGLNVAPLLETALSRATTREDSAAIWEATPANVRPLLRQLRPQFAALMRGLDAYKTHDFDAAAKAFESITEGQWLQLAEPALQGLAEELAPLAGLYVPISATPGIPLAALWVEPQGFTGGNAKQVGLTFLNRLGTLASSNPRTYVSTPAARQLLTLQAPIILNTRMVALDAEAMASSPGGTALPTLYGPIKSLSFKANPQGGTLLTLQLKGAKPIQLSRVLNAPRDVLRPDGQYSILTALEHSLTSPITGGAEILPPGSLLTLQTAPTTQPASDIYGFTDEVYPLLGTLQHPASQKPISFTGEYDATTLTSGFTFIYPLKNSGQPVRAAVLCQSLAGTLHCGAHHLHSPRVAFAALSRGQQTQESLAAAIQTRKENAVSSTQALLAAATAARQARIAAAPQHTETAASASPQTISTTVKISSPTTPVVEVKQPSATIPEDNTEEAPETVTPAITATERPAPGVFIYRGDNPESQITTSSTTPETPNAE